MDKCGVTCCYPSFLQKFANTRSFLIVFGLLGTIQTASYAYFVVTLTTIEKRFKIPSQTTGIILSGNEMSQVMLSLLLTYFGGQQNRPKLIAWGVVLCGLSCFILTSPHYIYGAGEEALQYTKEFTSNQDISSIPQPIDSRNDLQNNKLCTNTSRNYDECDKDHEVFSYVPLVLIFMSQFVLGIGNTLYYSLGQSYLHDNTKQTNTPLMLAYAFTMRLIGPTIGYGLAYLVMNVYIDPRYTPNITKDDPHWLGAYWLGWNFLGAMTFAFAGLVGLFPKNLPKRKTKAIENKVDGEKCDQNGEIAEKREENEKVELKNFPTALMRLLKNKLLICLKLSTIFYVLGLTDHITYMGKVMEVQFKISAHTGSILTGPATILGSGIGLLSSGYYMTKYKPAPSYVFLWSAILTLFSISGQLFYTQIGCGGESSLMGNGSVFSCNTHCNCEGIAYDPVCDQTRGITYFSPCHAGCKSFNNETKVYEDCTCMIHNNVTTTITTTMEFKQIESQLALDELKSKESSHDYNEMIGANDEKSFHQIQTEHIITPKACVNHCQFDYYLFTIIRSLISFLSSTGYVGYVLICLRAVEQRDKSFSLGFSLFLVSLFALIPGPIIFGRIIDSTCLVWNSKCGRQGDCKLYDPIAFRYYLHTASATFYLLGFVFDLLVWHYSKNVKLYGNDDETVTAGIDLSKEEKDESPESQPLNK